MTAPLLKTRVVPSELSLVRDTTDAAVRTRRGAARRRRHDALIIGACLLVVLMALAELGPGAKARRQPVPTAGLLHLPMATAPATAGAGD